MSAFTPGPWYVIGEDASQSGPFIEIARGDCGTPSFHSVAEVHGNNDDLSLSDADWANARLIAAAPELFNIVQRFLDLPSAAWNPHSHAAAETELMQDALSVLAKIDGDQS